MYKQVEDRYLELSYGKSFFLMTLAVMTACHREEDEFDKSCATFDISKHQKLYFCPGAAKLMIFRSVNSSTPAIPPNRP